LSRRPKVTLSCSAEGKEGSPPGWKLDTRLTILPSKKIIVTKSKEVKSVCKLAGSSKESYGSERAVLPVMIMLLYPIHIRVPYEPVYIARIRRGVLKVHTSGPHCPNLTMNKWDEKKREL
jgi:hypothetical protein